MTPRELIESGLLELYVAGTSTADESRLVEDAIAVHPEVAREVEAICRALELAATEYALEPPSDLKNRMLEHVFEDGANSTEIRVPDSPPPMPMWPKYLVAASIGLLAGLLPALLVWMQLQDRTVELERARKQLADARLENSTIAANKANLEGVLERLADASITRVHLASIRGETATSASVYWNRQTHAVLIDPRKLPTLDESHSYQLWAIEGGKPVDLGVINAEPNDQQIIEMKASVAPAMFAITVEPRGGSPAPTLEAMIVAGKVG